MNKRALSTTAFLVSLNAVLAFSPIADANTGIELETVSDYSFVSGNHDQDTDANVEGDGFLTPMIAAGTGWNGEIHWIDGDVWDTDFYDPDLTGNAFDDDTNQFDSSTAALSMFIGHGTGFDLTNTPCTSDSQCNPANFGYCPDFPVPSGRQAACISNQPHTMVTSSSQSLHGNFVTYGAGNTALALGESSTSGGWAGVGQNGGTNVVIIVNSEGLRKRNIIPKVRDLLEFPAGVHEIMMCMPVGNLFDSAHPQSEASDTAQWSARGSTLANLILTNTNAPAKTAWLTPSFANSSYFGWGANAVTAYDTSSTTAKSRLDNETWQQTRDDSRDATSRVGGWTYWTCNFPNCSSYNL